MPEMCAERITRIDPNRPMDFTDVMSIILSLVNRDGVRNNSISIVYLASAGSPTEWLS